MIKAPVPFWVGAARNTDGLFIRIGDHNESSEPDPGQRTFCPTGFAPNLTIAIDKGSDGGGTMKVDWEGTQYSVGLKNGK